MSSGKESFAGGGWGMHAVQDLMQARVQACTRKLERETPRYHLTILNPQSQSRLASIAFSNARPLDMAEAVSAADIHPAAAPEIKPKVVEKVCCSLPQIV